MASAPFLGVISDTHGIVRPEALECLRGATAIVHAGDIGSPEVLAALAGIAPVTAIRGNNDTAAWAHDLPETTTLSWANHRIYLIHDRKQLTPLPVGIDMVVSGHSHKPGFVREAGVLYLNPGSAGPRRFKLPITLALVRVVGGALSPEIRTIGA
jgi:putative phosphoesterase